MFSQPVRASVVAVWCALSACSENAPASHASSNAPKYSLDRPTEGLSQPLPRDDTFRRGVSLDLFVAEVGEAERPSYATWLDQVTRVGATDLELVVQWSQLEADTVELAPSATLTVDDDFLGWLMDQARERHLRVLLTPLIELEQPAAPGSARALAPNDESRWFWSYHRFLLHYARIAEAHKADCFALGADLPPGLAQSKAWSPLIKDVRKAYKGKLTYAARSEHFDAVPFWGEVDYVGLAGVGPLLSADKKSGKAKQASQLLSRLRSWSKAHGKTYLLSSVRSGASYRPVEDVRGTTEQLVAMRGLYQSLQSETSMAGVYLSFALPGARKGAHAPPVASASAAVLHHWYGRSRASSN